MLTLSAHSSPRHHACEYHHQYHRDHRCNPTCPVRGHTRPPAPVTPVPVGVIVVHLLPDSWRQSVGNLGYHTNVE